MDSPFGYGPAFGDLGAINIIFNPMCLVKDGQHFKDSANRSGRVLKKLLKRYGQQDRMKPAMFQTGNTIIVHPSMRAEIEAVSRKRNP